jgi:GTP-sensing pleiotropic transcriptional regulator CodY
MTSAEKTRRRSAALFNNEKMAEVILALDDARGAAHAQEISQKTGITHSLVRDVLVRLLTAGVVAALPRVGGSRGTQYYQPQDEELWRRLVSLASYLADQESSTGPTGR